MTTTAPADVDTLDEFLAAARDLLELISIDSLPLPISICPRPGGLEVQVRAGATWEAWLPTVTEISETFAKDGYTHVHADAVTHTGRSFRLLVAYPTPDAAVAS